MAEEEPREPQEQAALLISFGEVLYRLEDYEEAFSWLRRGLAFSPRVTSPIPLPLILRPQAKAAEMFRQSGKVDEAIQVLERITIDFPFFCPNPCPAGTVARVAGAPGRGRQPIPKGSRGPTGAGVRARAIGGRAHL